MASKPVQLQKKSKKGGTTFTASGKQFAASEQTSRAKAMPRIDSDAKRTLTQYGWRELLSLSRYIYSNFGPVRGAINQMANYAVGWGFQPVYYGRNESWGELMQEALEQHDKICDVRGEPYDFRTSLILDMVSIIRDGDANFVLTETQDGYPMFQSIPAHRVGSRVATFSEQIEEGKYNGFFINNGVISNEVGRSVAFRVYEDADGESYTDVEAKDFGQIYRPELSDQPRGIPWLAPAINDIKDIWDIRNFTKTGIKGVASRIMLEHNESGQAPASPLEGGVSPDMSGTTQLERLDEGTILYARAGSGAKIEVPNDNRPSENSQQFSFEILRGCFEALGWPIEFYNPEALGGANIRLRVAQAERTIETLQMLAGKIATRKRLYAIAKLMKLGVLPWDDDWWKIQHQTPRSITVDNGRDTKADLEALKVGATTYYELYGQFGQDAKTELSKAIEFRAWFEKECAEKGVDPDKVIPNQSKAPAQAAEPDTQPTPQPDET